MNTVRKIILGLGVLLALTPVAAASFMPFNTSIHMNVGIGSASPGQTLDVQGTVRSTGLAVSGQGAAPGYVLTATDSTGDVTWSTAGGLSGWTTAVGIVYSTTGSNNIGIGTSTPQGGLVVTNGNVGIGTWVPQGYLDVRQNANGNTVLYSQRNTNASGGTGYFINFKDATPSVSQFAVDTTGAIIGGRIQLNPANGSGSAGVTYVLDAGDASTIQNTQGYRFRQYVTTGGTIPIFSIEPTLAGGGTYTSFLVNSTDTSAGANSKLMDLQVGGTSRLSVLDTGNVGIGTSTPQGGFVVTNGNVGIGTWTAGYKLDVMGNIAIGANTSTNEQAFLVRNDGPGVFGVYKDSQAANYNIVDNGYVVEVGTRGGSPYKSLETRGQTILATQTGNVGIGTSTPQGGLVVTNGNVGIGTWSPAGALIVMNGNLGIGVNNPSQKLQVAGAMVIDGLNAGTGVSLYSDAYNAAAGQDTLTIARYNTANQAFAFRTTSGSEEFRMINTAKFGWSSTNTNVPSTTDTAFSRLSTGVVGVGVGTTGNYSGVLVATNVGIGTFNISNGALIVTGGNVGISSVSPGQMLDVQGTVRSTGLAVSGQGAAPGYVLTATDSTGDVTWSTAGGLSGWTTAAGLVYSTTGSNNIGIGTSTPQGGLVVTNGNVGIGTWAPSAKFVVSGNIFGLGDTNALGSRSSVSTSIGLNLIPELDVSNGIGVYVDAYDTDSTLDNTISVQAESHVGHGGSPSSFGNVYGFYAKAPVVNNGASTINNYYGYYADTVGNSEVTNSYGLYLNAFAGTNKYGVYVNGEGSDYFSGNVGIGSVSPGAALDVNGIIQSNARLVLTNPSLLIWGTDRVISGAPNIESENTNGMELGTASGGPLVLETNEAERLRITQAGSIGIGTTTPGSALDVAGSVTSRNEININHAGGTTRVANIGADDDIGSGLLNGSDLLIKSVISGSNIGFETNNSNSASLFIASGGNIGIGTIIPVGILNLSASAAGIGNVLTMSLSEGTKYNWRIGANSNIDNGFEITPSTATGGSSYTTPAITVLGSSRNVGIGSSYPGQKLDVQGTVRSTGLAVSGQGAAPGYVLTATDSTGDVTWSTAGGLSGWTTGTGLVYSTTGSNNIGIGTSTPQGGLVVTNGNVGIGTWAPTQLLTVGNGGLTVDSSGDITSTGQTYNYGTGPVNVVYGTAPSANQSFTMKITPSNNKTNWQISTNSYVSGAFEITPSTAAGGSTFTTPALTLNTNGTAMAINAGNGTAAWGNWDAVQLGTYAAFSGQAAGDSADMTTNMDFNVGVWNYINTAAATHLNLSGGAFTFKNAVSGTAGTTITETNLMEITSAGNVGIGTITPQGAFTVTNGNVGIGTWAPRAAFHVTAPANGSFAMILQKSSAFTGNQAIDYQNSSGTEIAFVGYPTGSDDRFSIFNKVASSPLTFGTAGNEQMRIDSAGNVGIGSTAPGALLDVTNTLNNQIRVNSTNAAARIALNNTNTSGKQWDVQSVVATQREGNFEVQDDTSGHVPLKIDHNDNVLLDSLNDGNVGIGTTSPVAELEIKGSTADTLSITSSGYSGGTNRSIIVTNSGTSTNGYAGAFNATGATTNNYAGYFNATGGSANNYGVYVNNGVSYFASNVGIGSTAPGKTLDVAGTARVTGFTMNVSPVNGYVLTSDNNGNGTWMANAASGGWTWSGLRIYATNGNVNVGIGTSTPQGALTVTNGNVGIGTWSPNEPLQVTGNIGIGSSITDSGGSARLTITGTTVEVNLQ